LGEAHQTLVRRQEFIPAAWPLKVLDRLIALAPLEGDANGAIRQRLQWTLELADQRKATAAKVRNMRGS
jgi:hypothetical protein